MLIKRQRAVCIWLLFVPVLLMCWGCSRSDRLAGKPPRPPANVEVNFAPQGLQVSWDKVPGATHYTVFWGKVDGEYTNLTDSTANSIIINGLAQNERYALAVTAWNERGESDYCEGPAVLYDNDPGRAGHHLTKGSDLMERGQYQEAYQHISAAIQLAPDSADGYRLRGLLYEKLKRSDLARLDYEAAERILKQKPPPEKQSIALQRAAERRQNLFDPKLVR